MYCTYVHTKPATLYDVIKTSLACELNKIMKDGAGQIIPIVQYQNNLGYIIACFIITESAWTCTMVVYIFSYMTNIICRGFIKLNWKMHQA